MWSMSEFLLFGKQLNSIFGIPPGFLPKDTAKHHQAVALDVLRKALKQADISPEDVDVICYTKGICCFLHQC